MKIFFFIYVIISSGVKLFIVIFVVFVIYLERNGELHAIKKTEIQEHTPVHNLLFIFFLLESDRDVYDTKVSRGVV